jgi:hypothetical protein
MVHIIVSMIIVIGRPDLLRILLIGIDVDHPSKDVRIKHTVCRFTGLLRDDVGLSGSKCDLA